MRAMLSTGQTRPAYRATMGFPREAAMAEAEHILSETEPEAVAKGRAGDVGVYFGDCLDALAAAIADALPLLDELAHFAAGRAWTVRSSAETILLHMGIEERNRTTDAALDVRS